MSVGRNSNLTPDLMSLKNLGRTTPNAGEYRRIREDVNENYVPLSKKTINSDLSKNQDY